jgi:hypothetical protein
LKNQGSKVVSSTLWKQMLHFAKGTPMLNKLETSQQVTFAHVLNSQQVFSFVYHLEGFDNEGK